MEVVSSQTDEDLARAEAALRLRGVARSLAANMLRIVRGAGRPFDLLAQCHEYLKASQQFFDTHRVWPTHETVSAVSVRNRDETLVRDDFEQQWQHYQREIIEGALQMVASDLLGQRTQEAAGERQLREGFYGIERIREERRKEREAAAAVAKKPKRATKLS